MTYVEERRRYQRINVRFTVSCQLYNSPKVVMIVGGKSLYALMIDLSESGMALETKYNLPQGSTLLMKFTLINYLCRDENNRFRTMQIEGEVRNNSRFEDKEYRIGIEFTKIDNNDKEAISECVRNTIKPREPY
jgi:c-di-GMP-binding flagellar brake protein YcgR